MREYLNAADILALHQALLNRYGGAPGIRDHGAIEAAIFRPQCGYYHDILEEAAALFESLLMNHPFVDGNKRVAFAACDVFLRLNGHHFNADPAWLYQRMMLWLHCQHSRFEGMVDDLRSCVHPSQ